MICKLCKEEIDIERERYNHIEDWDNMKIINEIWTHTRCFKTAMNRDLNALQKQAKVLMDKMTPMINDLT